jgi:GAF domain-containing protein
VEIDLLSHPLLQELQRTHALQLNDLDVEPRDGSASIRHSIEKVGDAYRLVVDHSHFTAKRTEFSLNDKDGTKTAERIVQAVQDAVIGLQSRTFEMLASVNGAVINSLDENEIVHNVLREVMHVLPHCDAGVFRLFDEASGFLVPVSHVGLPEDYSHYRVQPNESVSGEVFATGRPAIHNGRQNIIDAHRVMRPESQSFMERSEIANALLCVPVMAEGKRLGTLTTLCFSGDGAFSVFDRTVLEFLAAQIAVAFQRSLTYKNAVATSHRLEQMRSDLARKNAELDRAVELHEALLRIFSTSNGLTEQLRAVAELFRVDFRFENVLGLDYRSSGWTDNEQFVIQAVEVAEAPVGQFHFPTSGDAGFYRVLFGTLATFVALDFVRDMSRMDVLNARRKAHFEALVAGLGSDERHSHHGFRLDRYSQVFVVRAPRREASDNTRLSLHKSQSDMQKGMTLSNSLIFHSEDQS